MIELGCSLAGATTVLPHVWEHTVGCGHASLLLRADLQAHLRQCRRELGFGHVRFHGLLSAPMDALVCQDEKWLYSFFDADEIIDFLRSIGMRPFVELSFMPDALASGSKTVFHYRANVTPPKDPSEWASLITRLVRHWVDRYGRDEVVQWPFEVWNEPNLEAFGSGRQADYFVLYRETVRAIKTVDASLQVGGPATAASAWVDDFLAFAQRSSLPVDFVSTHQYPTDAFGEPGDDTETQLSKSRRGVMREHAQRVRQQCGDRPLYYTEWNTSSNPRDPLHDQPFAAAFAVNIVMSVVGVVDGYSWWTCSDIFKENYMPSVPYQGGFGLLNIHGVPKPVYRAFELLHRMGTSRLDVEGSQGNVSAWASRLDATHVSLLVTNHALPRHDVATERVRVVFRDARAPQGVTIERIDDDHANAPAAWRLLGSPEYPSPDQVEHLKSRSSLVRESLPFTFDGHQVALTFDLMPHAVAAITIECARPPESPA